MPQASSLRWRAGTDQIDHAHRKGELRTLCGLRIIEERRAWPPTIKCHECVAAAAVKV